MMQESEVRPAAQREWKTWATVDDDGQLRTLGEISSRRRDAERTIAKQLGETEKQPLRKIHLIVKVAGPDQALAWTQEALEIERQGGMMLPDGSRRRTPGGVFFSLVREKGSKAVKSIWYVKPEKKTNSVQALPRVDKKQKPVTTQPPAAVAGEHTEQKKGTTVKITLIGRPIGQVVDKGTYVALVLQSSRVPALPKGLPAPAPDPTNYVVHVASKQWKNVTQAIEDPEDTLIIEGFPQMNAQKGTILVFAMSVTTKNLQRAKRAENG